MTVWVEIWAYCLMPNHTHVIAVPKYVDGLAKVMEQVQTATAPLAPKNSSKDWKN
ncbi:transposase [Terasakiella sp. SH-1]|uniref:transposase n=1 Tax=Terasakiella sp. SH-1 TaxID=2560057 RepID=UPI0019807CA2|nr:transposase [Terasakiella sp. SH-1]